MADFAFDVNLEDGTVEQVKASAIRLREECDRRHVPRQRRIDFSASILASLRRSIVLDGVDVDLRFEAWCEGFGLETSEVHFTRSSDASS